MAHVNFVIPQTLQDLLEETDEQYYVRDVLLLSEITSALKTAKQCYKDEGPEFILENFDVFYTILHHSSNLQIDTIFTGYEQLHKAAQDLNKSLGFLLEDKDNLSEETKTKYQNVIKMLMYAYVSTVNVIEQKNETRRMQTLTVKSKGRGKKNEDSYRYTCNHKDVILTLNFNIQKDISVLWDPPIVDESFINIVSEVCYCFLESPNLKAEKEVRTEIWSMLGTLVKSYSHGSSFVVRIVQLIKIHEHLVSCVPEGIQHLVDHFGCKGLVRDFVREITEWQTDEQFTNTQGTRHCSNVLSEMAVLMPTLMIPEVMYLNRYLTHESYALRNSVLSVIVEVIITVLTKNNLEDDARESRDEFLEILLEHTADVSVHVRSRVLQHWMRLQIETAVPLKMQSIILEKAVFHLQDRGALVRKSAANCVTIFLEHNMFGFDLKLSEVKEKFEQTKEARNLLKAELEGLNVEQLKRLEAEWNLKKHPLRETIDKILDRDDDSSKVPEVNTENLSEVIRGYIVDDKFEEAVVLWKAVGREMPQFQEYYETMQEGEDVDFVMVVMHYIFMNIPERLAEAAAAGDKQGPTEEQLLQLTTLDQRLDLLTDSVKFLEHIDNARKPMTDLLESVSICDMQAAVDFFVAAYKFNIDNALIGILEILKMIQRGEQDRKDMVLNAFKTVFLTTDTKSMIEHTTTVVDRLIDLLMTISFDNYPNMALLVSEWVSKGTLDNSVIDILWQYFTKKIEVSDDKSRGALTLLTMAAQGRSTIIKRNIKLVSTVAFSERGLNDILLATQACKILSVAGMEKQNITDENPPFRIKASDSIWKEVCDLFVTFFDKRVKFVNGFIAAAIDFIYRLCSTPIKIIENVVKTVLNKFASNIENNNVPTYMIVRCNVMLGTVALKELNFLDEVVYKELKRRNYIREELKEKKNGKKTPKSKSKSNKSALDHGKNLSISMAGDAADESVLEGAQADDTDADFIVEVLENRTVTENTGLGDLAGFIIKVCENPDVYSEEHVQCTAVTALLRYMLVASRFCEKYIQLTFTILEKTPYTDVKEIILAHCSDLLERWPNIIEPFTPRIYNKLKDDDVRVRKITVFVLSNLILRDMIRAQGHIAEVALCIVDKEQEISDMAKNFFLQLSHKTNNLYNVLPDIFSHLCETTDDASIKTIMKYLFSLIDKNKQMENLVDRFCAKFKLTEDEEISKNIAYCLALINYNEKGLRKLIDNFATYKHLVLNSDIYATFKQILNACVKGGKNDMKVLVTELEEKIKMMFEVTEGAVEPTAARLASKAKQSTRKRKPKSGGRGRKQRSSDDSDEGGFDKENISNTAKKSKRTGRARKVARFSSSDSSD